MDRTPIASSSRGTGCYRIRTLAPPASTSAAKLDAINPIRTMSRLRTTIPPFNEVLFRRRCVSLKCGAPLLGWFPAL